MLWGVRNAVVVFYDSRARRRFKGVCVWIDNICAHVKMRGGKLVVAVNVPDVPVAFKVDCRLRNPHRPVVRLGLYQKAVFASLSPVPYIRGLCPRREYRKLRAAVAAVDAVPKVELDARFAAMDVRQARMERLSDDGLMGDGR